jgi:hypothetical protein
MGIPRVSLLGKRSNSQNSDLPRHKEQGIPRRDRHLQDHAAVGTEMHVQACRLEGRILGASVVQGLNKWWELNSILCDELHLPPWEFTAYQHPDWESPFPEGSAAAEHDKPDLEAQERYRMLEMAAEG